MSNTTSLYSTTSSGNATVPPNNNTSLYNSTGVPQTVNNNISVTGNILAGGEISAVGNVYGANFVTTGNVYAGNIVGNIVGNLVLSGGNTEVVFNNNNSACSSPAFTFNNSSNTLAITGAVTATGNITGNYILGNGSQLTGLPATYGNSNVTSLLSSFGSNTVSTTGNVSAGYFLGDGSQLSNLPAGNYSNANVAAFLPTYTGAITANTVSATGNVAGLYILGDGSQLTNLPIPGVYGNTQVAAFMAAFGSNVVSTTGNVTAGYFLGDGSQLTGITTDYSNANVVSLMAAFGSNSISTTGNVTAGYVAGNGSLLTNITGANVSGQVANAVVAGTVTTAAQPNITSVGTLTSLTSSGNISGNYIIGDGSQLTNLPVQPGTYSNANVAAYLPVYTGDYAGGTMSLTGNVTAAYLKTSGATGNIVGANYVSANFYLGDGGLLSNISSSYGNAQVATFLNAFGSNTIVTTGNITGGYILGNGSQLTGLPATYSNANVATFLAAFGSNTISTTGNITSGNLTVSGIVYTPQIENSTSLDLNSPSEINLNANVRVGDNNSNTQIATHGTGDLLITTHQGDANQGNIRLYDGASGNIDITTNGTGKINLNGGVFSNDGITATGNVQANYVIGNGSLLSSLTGANVTGTVANATYATSAGSATTATNADHATVADSANSVAGGNVTGSVAQANYANIANSVSGSNVSGSVAQATFADTANAVAGGNVSGQVANALVAGTVYTNAQPNITSVGTLSSLSVAGNIVTGGILTDGYYYANGTPFSGGGGSTYGDSNVNTLLAAWGSNTLSTTGNVTSGLLKSGAVTYTSTDGTVGQVLTTYGNGQTYFSTVSGGGGSPGGSDSQIQYNNGGAFGGNVAMSFDDTTGNITLGNIVVNTNQIETVSVANLAATTASGQTTPWRILVGDAYNGNTNSAYSSTSAGTIASALNAPRLLVSDFVSVPNNGMRFQEHTNYVWANLSANVSNTSTRIGVQRNEITVGGGTSGYTITATNTASMILSTSNQINLGAGTNANLSLVGNITTTAGAMGSFNGVTVNNYSTANIIVGQQTSLTTNNANTTAWGNATTQIGHFMNFSGSPANANVTGTTTAVGYYMPGFTQIIPGITATNGNIARQAANYFSFRSDDTLAKAQLGSLSSFNEYTANTTSSTGTLTVNKANGQVQQVYPTENITTVAFSNFVTRVQKPDATYVNQSDTVTLIIVQGATPYTVTMPSGTGYKYAGGVNLVSSTANTTTMISITGTYNYNISANEYLITISPEFS